MNEEIKTKLIPIPLENTEKNFTILDSILGQLSDGMWENSPRMEGYWKFCDVKVIDGNLVFEIDARQAELEPIWDYRYDRFFKRSFKILKRHRWIANPYYDHNFALNYICKKFAGFLKTIVKAETGKFDKNNNSSELCYLSRNNICITPADAYKMYNALYTAEKTITK